MAERPEDPAAGRRAPLAAGAGEAVAQERAADGDGALPSVVQVLRITLTVVAVVITLYVIYLLRTPISWLVIAAFLATALAGPVGVVSRFLPRGAAIATVYLGLVLFPALLIALLVPPLVNAADNLADNLPQYARDLQEFVQDNPTLRDLEAEFDITGRLQEQAAELPGRVGDAAGVLSDIGLGLVNSLFALLNIIILSIFMVSGGPRWLAAFAGRQPPHRAEAIRRLAARVSAAVSGYVAGALTQATIAGVSSWLVLTILDVPAAPALAVIIFLLDLVPLVGATIGAVIVGVVTVFVDFPLTTIIWTIWAIIYQQVENNVIQPRIQSRAVQVAPFVVLVSVLCGSTLFGVLGALLAIPFAATLQIVVREYLRYRDAERALSPPTAAP
jgi:predicted PurR-regulated permease PerM